MALAARFADRMIAGQRAGLDHAQKTGRE